LAPGLAVICRRAAGAREDFADLPHWQRAALVVEDADFVPEPLPTLPGFCSHSRPLITVPPVASVAARISFTFSAPIRSIQPRLTQSGHGAARCQRRRTLERSAMFSFSLRSIRSIMVGTKFRTVGRCFSIAARHLSASNFSLSTALPPRNRMIS
jgi:hypothetical protein